MGLLFSSWTAGDASRNAHYDHFVLFPIPSIVPLLRRGQMKVVKSLERLKGDVSRMLLRQDPDVIFTRNNSTCTTAETFDGQIDPLTSATTRAEAADGSDTVGAHLAILR